MNQPIKIQQKFPKFLSQRIRKLEYKTLGTSVIPSLMSPPSLVNVCESLVMLKECFTEMNEMWFLMPIIFISLTVLAYWLLCFNMIYGFTYYWLKLIVGILEWPLWVKKSIWFRETNVLLDLYYKVFLEGKGGGGVINFNRRWLVENRRRILIKIWYIIKTYM